MSGSTKEYIITDMLFPAITYLGTEENKPLKFVNY